MGNPAEERLASYLKITGAGEAGPLQRSQDRQAIRKGKRLTTKVTKEHKGKRAGERMLTRWEGWQAAGLQAAAAGGKD